MTLEILIDYSKVFDTIDHCFLLEERQEMNCANNSIKMICSYLMIHYQYVQIEDKKSILLPVFFSGLQGSILESFVFNLYVAAKFADLMSSTSIQYADVTTVYWHCNLYLSLQDRIGCKSTVITVIQDRMGWKSTVVTVI